MAKVKERDPNLAADQPLVLRILPEHFSISKIGTGGEIKKEDGKTLFLYLPDIQTT